MTVTTLNMQLPSVPMAPITKSDIPIGPEWAYQIKWDGARTLARLDGRGEVELFSKRIEPKNIAYPQIVELLEPLRIGPCVLDGEILYFDGTRPNFQQLRKKGQSLLFVMFDMLYFDGQDIRHLPFTERFEKLQSCFPERQPRLFVTDLFTDGPALWEWVEKHEWEGIISKQIDSPYVEGKKHQFWFKKRKEVRIVADVVGLKLKNGRVSSLVLRYEDRYIGHVSLGLDEESRRILQKFAKEHPGDNPFANLTPGMQKSNVAWLSVPFPCLVTALEFTDSGLLRQPKLIGFGGAE